MVVIDKSGKVVVTRDYGNIFSLGEAGGERLLSFSIRGYGGLAVDAEDNILLVDAVCYGIRKFTAKGQFLTVVGSKGSGPLQFHSPAGIAFNTSNNKVYVADTHNHRVQVLNSDLTFSSTFGKYGSSKGRFKEPLGITCDSTGKVYVADTANNRIQVFTAEGRFCMMFGRRGEGMRDLESPFGVAVDWRGRIYVSEWNTYRISVFTSEGQFVASYGRRGRESGLLLRGLAVDNSGVVYVCDQDSILMF